MKIALLGYGRMGKAIEKIALEKNHEICYKTSGGIEKTQLLEADVAIDFSIPEAAFHNIATCLENRVPVVSGTTGWLDKFEKTVALCQENQGAFLYASNFSIGVNLFFELNKQLAHIMRELPDYRVRIEEIHHTKKLDAPSGTAISLANQIIENTDKTNWKLVPNKISGDEKEKASTVPIIAKRIPEVPGTHCVKYASAIDTIEIKHIAHSREGFARGAVMAAEWLQDKTGTYEMRDVVKNLFL